MKTLALIPAYTHIDDRLLDALAATNTPFHAARRCSDLPKARSLLLTLALEQSKAEVFLLIDSDMVPTAEQMTRLVESPKLTEFSAVSGAYALSDGRSAFMPMNLAETVELGVPGYTELRGSGLGFAAVHRHSLVNITRQLPRITNTGPQSWWPFCVPVVHVSNSAGEGSYYPDDYSLWLRHGEEGGTLWLDRELLVAHNFAQPRRPTPGPVTRD